MWDFDIELKQTWNLSQRSSSKINPRTAWHKKLTISKAKIIWKQSRAFEIIAKQNSESKRIAIKIEKGNVNLIEKRYRGAEVENIWTIDLTSWEQKLAITVKEVK